MSDLIVGIAVVALALVVVVLPAVLVARWQDRRQAGARHCLRRPHPAVVLARDLLGLLPPAPAPATWDRIRAGMRPAPRYVDTGRTLAEMNGDGWLCEPNPAAVCDDIRARWDRIRADNPGLPGMRDCCLAFDNEPHWRDCEARAVPMSPDPEAKPFTGWQVPDDWRLPGRRGLMFARPRTPWPSAADPVTPVATDDLPPWDVETAQQDAVPAYGVDRCELDVDVARRHYALALGPDGCEET